MRMTVDEAMRLVEKEMPAKRWRHTLGVIESAVALAERFGGDAEKARVAALLHDVAKYWPVERQREAILEDGDAAGLDTLSGDKVLWHSHAGAFVARRDFGVTDAETLNAIRYHTSGRPGMTLLEKIVCLADYIEPGREYPGVERLRELSGHSLEEALVAGFDGTLRFLIEQGKHIYPLTVLTRNDLLTHIRPGGF